ncbi:hypothetical protein MPH_09596 [Macrophomina phaseolina MS6]|uniref:Uncharacterized protein n=1 Tax=Macrophomina phaseolina (strain MS6) TaxID=1126212 RepID=K2RSU7_MACPH|nr:hypothetical protein MPH_09596 [Macrophomina phaseolina MS6]
MLNWRSYDWNWRQLDRHLCLLAPKGAEAIWPDASVQRLGCTHIPDGYFKALRQGHFDADIRGAWCGPVAAGSQLAKNATLCTVTNQMRKIRRLAWEKKESELSSLCLTEAL